MFGTQPFLLYSFPSIKKYVDFKHKIQRTQNFYSEDNSKNFQGSAAAGKMIK